MQRLSPPTSLSWDLERREGGGPIHDGPMVARTYLGRFSSGAGRPAGQDRPKWAKTTPQALSGPPPGAEGQPHVT